MRRFFRMLALALLALAMQAPVARCAPSFTMPRYESAAQLSRHPQATQGKIQNRTVRGTTQEFSIQLSPEYGEGVMRSPAISISGGKDYLARAHADLIAVPAAFEFLFPSH